MKLFVELNQNFVFFTLCHAFSGWCWFSLQVSRKGLEALRCYIFDCKFSMCSIRCENDGWNWIWSHASHNNHHAQYGSLANGAHRCANSVHRKYVLFEGTYFKTALQTCTKYARWRFTFAQGGVKMCWLLEAAAGGGRNMKRQVQ